MDITYFYEKDENGNVILDSNDKPVFRIRPVTANLSGLEQSIKNARPQKGIDATAQKVADGINWQHLDNYQTKLTRYETALSNYQIQLDKYNSVLAIDPQSPMIPPEHPIEPATLSFEETTAEMVKTLVVDFQWEQNRKRAYGHWGDQLDEIYHGGVDAWQTRIAAVKAQFPKP